MPSVRKKTLRRKAGTPLTRELLVAANDAAKLNRRLIRLAARMEPFEQEQRTFEEVEQNATAASKQSPGLPWSLKGGLGEPDGKVKHRITRRKKGA